jgi:opacity protein-like surface antigen
MRPGWKILVSGLLAIALGGDAAAGDFYLTGDLAISTGEGSTGGTNTFFESMGSDSDSAPAYGGAVGFGFELSEAIPKTWELPLPGWGVRAEFEGITGREYELRTRGASPDSMFSEVTAWTFMPNLWIDVPLHAPIEWAFERIPILEPLTLYTGAGFGLSTVDLDTTDNVSRGHQEQFLFGWQAGIGFGYELTQRVTLTAGYRYVDLGHAKVGLKVIGAEDSIGPFTMDLVAHEATFGVRVKFYSIPYPEKWALRHDVL